MGTVRWAKKIDIYYRSINSFSAIPYKTQIHFKKKLYISSLILNSVFYEQYSCSS
jgi:hypothetical protein